MFTCGLVIYIRMIYEITYIIIKNSLTHVTLYHIPLKCRPFLSFILFQHRS